MFRLEKLHLARWQAAHRAVGRMGILGYRINEMCVFLLHKRKRIDQIGWLQERCAGIDTAGILDIPSDRIAKP